MGEKIDNSEEIQELLNSIYRLIDITDSQFTSEESTWYEEPSGSDILSEY